MNIKKKLLLLTAFMISLSAHSQNFLNGDFEINTAGIDRINLQNSGYNGYMSNSTAFGNLSGGGANGGDMDIITSSGYCDIPQHGNWYVALTSGGTDAVSLELSSPLIAGNSYRIIFYDRSCAPYTAGSPVQIGVANLPDTFGNLVYTAPAPVYNGGWTQRDFTFIAPASGLYITVTCGGPNSGSPWTQIDNFSMEEGTGVPTINQSAYFHVYPNPASDYLYIKPFANDHRVKSISISNPFGHQVFSSKYSDEINISDLANGVYILKLSTDKETYFVKFLKQ